MATEMKTITKKTEKIKVEKPKKLSKLGQWMRANPKGDIIINDPKVLNGLSIYEIFN